MKIKKFRIDYEDGSWELKVNGELKSKITPTALVRFGGLCIAVGIIALHLS